MANKATDNEENTVSLGSIFVYIHRLFLSLGLRKVLKTEPRETVFSLLSVALLASFHLIIYRA